MDSTWDFTRRTSQIDEGDLRVKADQDNILRKDEVTPEVPWPSIVITFQTAL